MIQARIYPLKNIIERTKAMNFKITGPLLVISLLLILGINTTRGQSFKNEARALLAEGKTEASPLILEQDLEGLPLIVQRYLRYTGVVGYSRITTVRVKQKGFMRMAEDKSWLPLKAEQYYTTKSPNFIWKGTVKAAPLLKIVAKDRYRMGRGEMQVRLWGLFKVADISGPELDQGALLRYLNEGMWFPTVYLEDYITWEPLDSLSAKATMTYKGVTASAVFYFNEIGQLINFKADRYMEKEGTFELRPWSIPLDAYRELNGLILPVSGEAIWHLEEGDFSYIRLEIIEVEYNDDSTY